MAPRRTPWLRFLAVLLAFCSAACDSQESLSTSPPEELAAHPEAPLAGSTSQAAGAEEPVTSDQSPSSVPLTGTPRVKPRQATAPAKVFDSNRTPLGPWFDQLSARFKVGPDGDNWPTEVVSPFAEAKLAEWLLALGTNNEAFPEAVVSASWEPSTTLVPDDLAILRDDASMRALGGERFAPLGLVSTTATSEGKLGSENTGSLRKRLHAGIVEHWRDLLQPVRGPNMQVQVQVVGCSRMMRTHFTTLALVRLWGPGSDGMVQINLRLELKWNFASQPTLLSFHGMNYERVHLPAPAFAELTRPVLPQSAVPDIELFAGGIEYSSRHDRAIPSTSVYLGMHGLAVGDLDGDDLEDVYVARQGGLPNLLLQHLEDGTVRNVARDAGVDFLDDTGGVVICDLDGDGARDLAMGVGTAVLICWNDGKGVFAKRTALQLANGSQVYSLCAADADGDGDLDLYDTRYFAGSRAGAAPTPYHDARNGAPNAFWRQDAPRLFVNATAEVGLDHNNDRFSLAAIWEDLDGDGDLDLYVSNDFGRNNLYLATDGKFRDAAEELGAMDSAAGMGVSVADVELDGDLDLYVSNMHSPAGERIVSHRRFQKKSPLTVREAYLGHARGNSLLLGDGQGRFQRAVRQGVSGAEPGGWAWGAVFCDFDADGLSDIVVPNGFATGRRAPDLASFFWRVVVNASPKAGHATEPYLAAWTAISHMSQVVGLSWNGHERNYGYWNLGGGRFVDASGVTGLDFEDDGRVVSPCDWDLDGRLDLWIKNRTAPALRFMHGRLPSAPHWIGFELRGAEPNSEAVGALVELQLESGKVLRSRVYAGFGYLGSPSKRLRMGIPAGDKIVSGSVLWPLAGRMALPPLATGSMYRVTPDGAAEALVPSASNLDAVPHGPIAAGLQAPVVRVPSLTSVPLGALKLPGPSASMQSVSSLEGMPLLITLWGSWDGASLDFLSELGRSNLTSNGLRVWPVSLDKARHWKEAQQLIAATGIGQLGGRADLRTRKLFELVSSELIGSFDDLPLPLSLLLDSSGSLVCMYFGAPAIAMLEADVRALGDQAVAPCPLNLTGGRWAGNPPRRRFEQLITWLTKAGETEFAEQLKAASSR